MKHLLYLLFTATAFAKDLSTVVKEIEMDKNAKCSETRTSFGLCLGSAELAGVCYYSVKFDCAANSGDFGLKIKMKSVFGNATVRKVVYLN